MGFYENTNGVLSPIAGRGKAEYGASTVRTGTVNVSAIPADDTVTGTVTFDTPMPDANYIIDLKPNTTRINIIITAKSANGFSYTARNLFDIATSTWNFYYTAFKLYTDNEYNGLLNNQRYSTDEIDTGKTWIDGKKIYRKVVDCGALPNNTQKTVNHGISNLGEVTSIVGMSKYLSAGISIPLPYVGANNVYLYVSATGVVITTTSDLSAYTATKVIIEYTKTT